jgi:hypothetical protein
MTVSKEHTFDINLAADLLNSLEVDILNEDSPPEFHIYYVLPADAYDEFKCPDSKSVDGRVQCFKLKITSYSDINQYACRQIYRRGSRG